MALGAIFPDGDLRGVRFERAFVAPPEEVWRALATPEGVAAWLAPAVRWRLARGEPWEVAFGDGAAGGTVVAVEPGRRLELTWRTGGEPESLLRLEVRPAPGGCVLVLEHVRLDPSSAAGYGAGWQAHLEALEAVVAGRETGGDDTWWARYRKLRPAYDAAAGDRSG